MANLEQRHLRSSFRRRCFASCSWLEYHGHEGLNTILFVQSGACLSTSEMSPLLYAFASSSTEPLKGCSIVESVISRLKVSTSMARSFLKDSLVDGCRSNDACREFHCKVVT